MNNSTREITKLWLTQFDERLGWLSTTADDMTTEELVAVHTALSDRKKQLSDLLGVIEDEAAKRMANAGAKTAILEGIEGDPLSVEWKASSRRSEVKRDELIRDVEKLGNLDKNRINEVTGELRSVYETQLDLIKRCFRFEPRWSELTKAGINIDEYAETQWSFGIKVQKAAKL